MIQTVNFSDFCNAFRDMDRKENFSYEGLQLLFDFFEGNDPNMELDVIAICCDFYENDWKTIAHEYDIDLENLETDDEKYEAVKEYLEENTFLVGCTSDGFVYQAF